MLFDLDNAIIREHIRQAEFGIERESLRVNSDRNEYQPEQACQ